MPILEQVLERYPQSVKIVFKNFPIRSHKFASKAAVAALAADRQGKFWEFHDELFKNYRQLNEEKIEEIADALQLDKAQFEKDKEDPFLWQRVKHDYNEGIKLGIRGVPTVFINGRRLNDHSPDGYQAEVKKELNKIQNKK